MSILSDWKRHVYEPEVAELRAKIVSLRDALEQARTDLKVSEEGRRPLAEALEPFAEAARKAGISGKPPMFFVGADDYDRALAALTQTPVGE